MAIEPYQPEPAPPARLDVPMNVAPRVISRDRFCLGCGYNLRGLRIDDDCPECRRAILSNDPVPSGVASSSPMVADLRQLRLCDGCGYDLRGLPFGGACPECGLPKSMPAGGSLADPLARMPIEIIKHFRMACLAVSVVMLFGIVIVVRAMLGAGGPVALSTMLLVIAAAWMGAIWLATPAMTDKAAIARGFSSQGRLRVFARFLQIGWIIAALCALIIAMLPTPSAVPPEVFAVIRWIGVAMGLAGVWCFALLMERLAEWSRDEFALRTFNLSLWGIPLGTPPLLFVNLAALLGWSYGLLMVRGVGRVIVLLLGLAWLTALLTFPIAMLSLTKSVFLSVMHNREHQERTRRQMARQMEYDERLSESIGKLNPQPRK